MNFDISQVKHPKEKLYGSVMLAVGALIWALLIGFIMLSMLRGQLYSATLA